MASRRSRSGYSPEGAAREKRHRGGFVTLRLPRYVISKRLATGETAFYFNVPVRYRKVGCQVSNEPLGVDYSDACRRAKTLNALFDEWHAKMAGTAIVSVMSPESGTVDWLFREYKQSKAYLEKVAPRSRANYEWAMRELCEALTNSGARVGSHSIKSITPRGADKIYEKLVAGPRGERLRT